MVLPAEPTTPSAQIPATMRAAVLFGPGEFRVVEKPVPSRALAKCWSRSRCAASAAPTCESTKRSGRATRRTAQYTPGHEWTGTVVALGESVDEVAVGDRVAIHAHKGCGRCQNCVLGMYTACLNFGNLAKGHRATGMTLDGGFAEYVTHHVSALYPMPTHLTLEDAVLIMTAGTGMYGLDAVGGYVAGESVVVIGPGPVGLMAVQACKALGADRSCWSARARVGSTSAPGSARTTSSTRARKTRRRRPPTARAARGGPRDRGVGQSEPRLSSASRWSSAAARCCSWRSIPGRSRSI